MSRTFSNGKNGRVRRCLRIWLIGKRSAFADKAVSPKYPGVGSDRQNRRHIAGAKKFVHSRMRAAEKQTLQREVNDEAQRD